MSLFQKSVEKKYLSELDSVLIDKKYQQFQNYFGNPERQENIRNAKEEQFQEGFLRELFVKILGYTLNPEPDFNLTTELKNISNSKKTDGAVMKDGQALAVIELKSTQTTDLDTIEAQAFGYKNHHPKCVYVITSNFEKVRFYIHNAVEHIDFDLFNITYEQFSLMWLCLAKENLLTDVPLKIKDFSIVKEESVTKKLYADYSAFRKDIFNNLVHNNPDKDKLLLFKKTQKLLDRFLFIFFAEDRLLVPPNSIAQIIEKWKDDVDFGGAKPLFDIFKQYFNILNVGRPKSGKRQEIFAYNGGLFQPDEFLDSISIDDDILEKHTLKLSKYDFDTDVDVNILGHIFEHSLGEIENVQAEIRGEKLETQKSKRKKDGIYYTPKYITKYIVENTVRRLCEEKKIKLGIIYEEYARGRKNRKKDTVRGLEANLNTYRDWLLTLTILDPACGSGAFLNQALQFLITEHAKIDELLAQLLGGSIVFADITTDILEKNIYGVDLNEESVEIAKLSLWLRTAQKGRKLNTLSNNIKCGNSLIDDPAVAGEKAFNWQKEFPEIFANGGFDVVIGNPPYVRHEQFGEIKPALEKNYEVYNSIADLYVYFFEKGLCLLKEDGLFSIIVANKWISVTYAEPLRKWLTSKNIIELVDFGDLPVFADATAYPCMITMQRKDEVGSFRMAQIQHLQFDSLTSYVSQIQFEVNQLQLNESKWLLVDEQVSGLIDKLFNKGISLHEYTRGVIRRGVVTGCNNAFVITEDMKNALIKSDRSSAEIIKPFLTGRDVKKYSIDFKRKYLIFTRRGIEIEKYPAILNYLKQYKEVLEPKPKEYKGKWVGRKSGLYQWYEIQDSIEYYREFEKPKIIYPNICVGPEFAYDDAKYYSNQKCFIIPTEDKFLLGILNSQVFSFLFRMILPKLRGGYYEPGYAYLKKFPVINIDPNNAIYSKVVEGVETQQKLHNNIRKLISSFTIQLKARLNVVKLSTKLMTWNEMEIGQFLNEIKKTKTKLSLSEEAEWIQYFREQKDKAQIILSEIENTDDELNQIVYDLYGLTEEEIKIVEGSL